MNTKHYHDGFSLRCSYCNEKPKMESPNYDEDISYYCDCDKAKLENEMHREIWQVTRDIQKKYENDLQIDDKKIKEMKVKGHIYKAVFDAKLSIGCGFTKAEKVEEAFKIAMENVFK